MCGVLRSNSRDTELAVVAPQEVVAVMPPSVTFGESDTSKANPPHTDVLQHLNQEQGSSTEKDIPTIDLNEKDIQRAVALSMVERFGPGIICPNSSIPGVSSEDQDVSKALEVSLQESNSSTTIDIIDPNDRRRVPGIPVGLKNIGNSCWFNVVMQALFFIPAFRDMIVNYPKEIEMENSLSKVNSKLVVPVLRHLFGLLIGSDRKYIDPTEAVRLFQEQDMRRNAQQDVCEFINKLLEKLEEEFKYLLKREGIEKECADIGESKETDFENPVANLFYGQFKKSDLGNSDTTKLETFVLFILTVMKYKDIHESILASMTGVSCDEGEEQVTKPIQHDKWLKTLPSVLIFSLSRYEYSKEKMRAEKVHNKFDFPECLYMDRYMEANKDVIIKKRQKIAEIRQQLKSLYNVLDKYERFGSGEDKYPIANILKYTLEFAMLDKKIEDGSNVLIGMDVDAGEIVENDVDMVLEDDGKKEEINYLNKSNVEGSVLREVNLDDKVDLCIPNKKSKLLPPSPQSINSNEMTTLQACLPRWQKEVEDKVNALKTAIDDLEGQLTRIFDEPSLKHMAYKLHSIVVHEGQASGGHYWVYIYDSFKNVWMKFNDNQITESDWEEVMNDSVGGQNNASAYCLMYVDQSRYDSLFSNYKHTIDNWSAYLPLDLQEVVKQDNTSFLNEINEWEVKQDQSSRTSSDESRIVPATAPNSPDSFSVDEEETKFFFEIQTMLAQTLSDAFLKEEALVMIEEHKSHWIGCTIKKELTRLREFASSQPPRERYAEPCLIDLGIYLIKNNQSEVLLQWHTYELAWQISQRHNNASMIMLQRESAMALQSIRARFLPTLGPVYTEWKRLYQSLFTCACYFVNGYKKYQSQEYDMALIYMIQAMRLHLQIRDTPSQGGYKTLDEKILTFCLRTYLVEVNDKLVKAFKLAETREDALREAHSVNRLIMPALMYVNSSKDPADEAAADDVRNKWCLLIDYVSSKLKTQLVKQIIELLTNDECEINTKLSVKIPSVPKAVSLYKDYINCVAAIRELASRKEGHISEL